MTDVKTVAGQLQHRFGKQIAEYVINRGELTIEVPRQYLYEVCLALRDELNFRFEQLIDVCGIDYLHFGKSEWETQSATSSGFSRGANRIYPETALSTAPAKDDSQRFAVIYHLLSVKHNHRLRVRTFAESAPPMVPSVVDIWPAANWFEREAFDLYGILFSGHPDLRRIMTDYGFVGHPFRKDFPVSGYVEVRYDAKQERVVYEPVDIEPRTLVPKVIRQTAASKAQARESDNLNQSKAKENVDA